MKDEKTEVHEVIDNTKNKMSLTRWLVVLGFLFSIVILTIIKIQMPSFQLKYLLIIFGFITIISAIMFFGLGIIKKFQDTKAKELNEDKLPAVATAEQLIAKCEKVLASTEHKNHVKQILNITPKIVNKNQIYDFEIIPLYNEKTNRDIVHIILNAHYIDRLPAVLFNPSPQKVMSSMNDCSLSPNPDAEIERRQEVDLMTGKEVIYEKKTPGRLDSKKEEPKKDLA